MIINNFDIFCESIRPTTADSPLIIDVNGVLTRTTALERFKVIARWNSQILKAISDFELPEFSPGNLDELVKSPKLRHARGGGHPELPVITGFPPSRE
jgi:hypothetical protein